MVIADNLAPFVDAVYGDPDAYAGRALVTATVFFAFQIYCDFSGYTDTARGVARMLGFELMKNFDFPYFSRTPVEFWRRWHISLSQWFQDYLYYPLAMRYMRRGGWGSKYKAHIVAMTLIGFWHGANWTFIVFRSLLGRSYRPVFVRHGPYGHRFAGERTAAPVCGAPHAGPGDFCYGHVFRCLHRLDLFPRRLDERCLEDCRSRLFPGGAGDRLAG